MQGSRRGPEGTILHNGLTAQRQPESVLPMRRFIGTDATHNEDPFAVTTTRHEVVDACSTPMRVWSEFAHNIQKM